MRELYKSNRVLVLIATIAIMCQLGYGQIPGELTNEELNLQKLYIEASQARLMGSNDDAARLYKEILSQDPQNDAAAYEYSRVLYNLEQYREALDQIEVAIRHGGDNPWYWLMKGDLLEVVEQYAGAIDVYKKLIEIRPDERYYYLHQVDLLLKVRQPEEAVNVLNQLEAQTGVEPDVIRKKVEILDDLGRPAEALQEIEKLLRYYPGEIEYLHLAAIYAVDAGMEEQATDFFNMILEIDPDDAPANLYAANKFKNSGDDVEYLQSIIPLMQNSEIEADAKVAELIPYLEKYAESPAPDLGRALEQAINELVKNHGDEAKVYALYGDYLNISGNLPEAASAYERTLVLDKGVFDVWEQLMYIKAEMYDMDGLIRTSEQALNVFPNQASIYYLRGLAYGYKQDHEQAIDELQQALIMSGRNNELRFHVLHMMGQVYMEMGDTAKAYEAFDKALDINENDLTLLTQYSSILAASGSDNTRAAELARRANEISPGDYKIEHTLGMIAYADNDMKKAFDYIDQSLEHGGGDDPVILEHFGDVLFSLDKVDEAVEYWQLSLDGGNQSTVLKRKITERRIIH